VDDGKSEVMPKTVNDAGPEVGLGKRCAVADRLSSEFREARLAVLILESAR